MRLTCGRASDRDDAMATLHQGRPAVPVTLGMGRASRRRFMRRMIPDACPAGRPPAVRTAGPVPPRGGGGTQYAGPVAVEIECFSPPRDRTCRDS